ncbi:hypothetical protein D3C74_384500 [compost metagenome]
MGILFQEIQRLIKQGNAVDRNLLYLIKNDHGMTQVMQATGIAVAFGIKNIKELDKGSKNDWVVPIVASKLKLLFVRNKSVICFITIFHTNRFVLDNIGMMF